MKQIAQGAEAKLYFDGITLRKKRIAKGYRIKEIDDELRKTRTKREAKVLRQVEALGILAPKLKKVDDFQIDMEYIDGEKLVDILNGKNLNLVKQIAKAVKILHENHITHGDLTTSNMILKGKKVYLIDFGLSYQSTKLEDFAVDIHLFKQALKSKHPSISEKAFKIFKKEYNNKEVFLRLEKVESRGRYKH